MGYRTAAYGTIAITPPIPWGKIKDSPFRPNELGGSLDLDIHLMVVGDMWRLKVVDRRAVRFDPHIVWPGASE